MHSYDATLKELFQKGRFLEALIGAPVAEFLAVEYQNVQQRRPDLVVRTSGGETVHIELLTYPEKRIEWRMFSYRGMISEQVDAPVRQILLYAGPPSKAMPDRISEPDLDFRSR